MALDSTPNISSEFMPVLGDPSTVSHWLVANCLATTDQVLNWRWHMAHQVTDHAAAARYIKPLPQETDGFTALAPIFNAGITPYYMALAALSPHAPEICPIRLQALPRTDELVDDIGLVDPLAEVPQSPVPEVVHMYPDRVAFCVAQLCPVYCRYCFRKRRDEEVGLHFNPRIIQNGIDYIASNKAIRDVLVTGGDPFHSACQPLHQSEPGARICLPAGDRLRPVALRLRGELHDVGRRTEAQGARRGPDATVP